MNIAPSLLKSKLSLLKETTNKYKMKLKQSLIDNLVSSDWTR